MCRYHREWVDEVKGSLPDNVSLHQVDAHNIVPIWEASDKQEYGARTIRSTNLTDRRKAVVMAKCV